MKVKRLKITYNNKKIVPKIKRYIVKYIQNLDKVLANLE